MRKLITILIILQTLFCKLSFSQNAGDLDSTFGVNGIVVTEMEGYDSHFKHLVHIDGIHSIYALPSGKILCAGNVDSFKHFVAGRYLENGDIDESYGVNGFAIIENLGFSICSTLTDNGSLIMAGGNHHNFVMVKITSDGIIDSTFGEYGIVETDISGIGYRDIIQGIGIQNDGKIVVFGSIINDTFMYEQHLVIARYLPNGELNLEFGDDGVIHYTSIPTIYELPKMDVKVLNDNKIIISGGMNSSFSIIRFKENGQIDSSFAINGIRNIHFSSLDAGGGGHFRCSSYNSDSVLFYTGYSSVFSMLNVNIVLAKIDKEGNVDSSFAENGRMMYMEIDPSYNFSNSIVVQSNNKIITSGYRLYSDESEWKFCFEIIRFHEDGTIDSTFGENGIVRTHISDSSQAFCSALQEDGKLLVAGVSDSGAFTIARYHAHSDTPTSILPLEKYNTLLLYPNPVSDILFIDKIQEPILQIEIRNILGREMHLPINNQSIDVSSLPSGLYFIKIKTDKGESFGKFVKE